jgi:hypothetical protein
LSFIATARLRIVASRLAERIHGRAREPRIEPAGGEIRIVLQGLGELASGHAQVGLVEVRDG